jgi:diguanylate cyclase (GGDEF)-like protein
VHERFTEFHRKLGTPYALIISDLDHFKSINDTYGHQAGDEALVVFAALLKKFCRSGDLVARYGGEEFVLLCPNCDNQAAGRRAEEIREAWAGRPHPMLGGKCLTASLGVTELQPGDTPETMLRRADRALLQAKDTGRNAVVQLGSGMAETGGTPLRRSRWLQWLTHRPTRQLLERKLVTTVPLSLAIEKLRGFVSDQSAQIIRVGEKCLTLRIDGRSGPMMRRTADRPTPFTIDLELEEAQVDSENQRGTADTHTIVQVAVRPKRKRDHGRRDTEQRARELLASLKAYLMAQDFER